MSQLFNQPKIIAVFDSLPQQPHNFADFSIIGINQYLKSSYFSSHLKILIRGNPHQVINHILWNQVYQKTLLKEVYEKIISYGGNKDSIFIRINGGDPFPLAKIISWNYRYQSNKNTNYQLYSSKHLPIQIQIQGFLENGGSKKVTIDIINFTDYDKGIYEHLINSADTTYNIVFQYFHLQKCSNQNNKKESFSKTLKFDEINTHKKSKTSFKNHVYASSTSKKLQINNCHNKCKKRGNQYVFDQEVKTQTPDKIKKIFQKYQVPIENQTYQKNKNQQQSRKNSNRLSTGRKSIKNILQNQKIIQSIDSLQPIKQKTSIQPITQRLSFQQLNQQKNYATKQSGKSISKNRQQMLGKIIRQKHAKLIALQKDFIQQQDKWNQILQKKQQSHQNQMKNIKNDVQSILSTYSQKCQTFKQQNQHLRAYADKARTDNQSLTHELAEAKVKLQQKNNRIKYLEEMINNKQSQWSRKIQRQKDRYLKIVKKLKLIEMQENEQDLKTRGSQSILPLNNKQNFRF